MVDLLVPTGATVEKHFIQEKKLIKVVNCTTFTYVSDTFEIGVCVVHFRSNFCFNRKNVPDIEAQVK